MSVFEGQSPDTIPFTIRLQPMGTIPQFIMVPASTAALVVGIGRQEDSEVLQITLDAIGPTQDEDGLEEISQMLTLVGQRLRDPDVVASIILSRTARDIQKEQEQ